jgi:hypothetical protein
LLVKSPPKAYVVFPAVREISCSRLKREEKFSPLCVLQNPDSSLKDGVAEQVVAKL